MAFHVGPAADDEPIAAINTTPLVDVMLVLLIIFLITIPVVNTSIAVDLPKERHEVRESKPENIVISVNAQGQVYWFDTPIDSKVQLVEKLKHLSALRPQPEIHVRGDRLSPYEPVGRVVLACQRAGITKVSFVLEPPPRS
jgi:biopolymer transport protein ExbD